MMKRRALAAAALAASAAAPAEGQPTAGGAFPNRPMRLVVPFPPGGPTDLIGRVLAQKLSALLGQPVMVENRSGGGGVVGTDTVAKAAPDGHTVAVTSAGALAIAPNLVASMPYQVGRDLAPVALVATVPELLAVHPDVPANTLAELVAHAKARPGRLNFASSGNGSMPHLAGEALRFAAGVEIVHVPYRGAAPAVTDLVSGQVQMMFADLPVLLPQVRSGALRAVVLAGKERAPLLPEVPTTAEAGMPQVLAENWYGLVAPTRTPEPVLTVLRDASARALRDPEVEAALREQGARAAGGMGGEEFAAFVRAEAERWGEVARRSGATMD
ncbi:tripartite tricarboxylate transporter substrate binding protein [Craurococcus roseus]|uniref:Tripartite tricarboxylate transporter substrate binding protein n=1 Tax=Craurococcus roseus TaxID=77585 RepID=A0ABN1F277_9PROT